MAMAHLFASGLDEMGEEGDGHDAAGAAAVQGEDAKPLLTGLPGPPLVIA